MVKQFFKKKSKRVSCRTKYKIDKKVREHNRKTRKDEKSHSHKRKKDPGLSNACPFKDEVLQEAEARKRRAEEEKERQKEKRKRERDQLLTKKRNMDVLVRDAQRRGEEFNRKNAVETEVAKTYTGGKAVEASLKAYYKEFKKVVDAAEVVIQVLDARDPLGSRCPQVEEAVLNAGTNTKLVLLLNKIDLVPRENVEKWLKHLRNEFPTVAFKASTQTQRANLSQKKVSVSTANDEQLKGSGCLGADMLMKLLGNYCRNEDIKTAIRVGVVGFPNTGKSSVINSLKRSKACSVGSTPGVTKSMQEVQIDKHVKLLDSPGVVMATGRTDAATILRNCVKVESIEDPITPVSAILKRCTKQQMMMHYTLPNFDDVNEFLALMAKRMGQLKKGGVPDINKAARKILMDWNQGKITYYTEPPEEYTRSTHLSATIVSQMGKAFDIEALLQDEENTLKTLKQASTMDIVVESDGPTAGVSQEAQIMEDDEEEIEMEEESEEEEDKEELKGVAVSTRGKSKSKLSKSSTPGTGKKGKTTPVAKPVPVDVLQMSKSKKKKVPTATLR